MKLSLLNLLYQSPALSWVGRQLPAGTLFFLCDRLVGMSLFWNSHTRRYLGPLESVLKPHLAAASLRRVMRQHLVYRRYLDNLPFIWRAWQKNPRYRIDGEEHLRAVLAEGKGAILLSSHSFGGARLIPPIFSARGYRMLRLGGWDRDEVVRHWGEDTERNWQQLKAGKDPWARLRATKKIAGALAQNALVYMAMRNSASGSPEHEVRIFDRSFFIEAAMVRLLEGLKAPVLPCFALFGAKGEVRIVIHPPLADNPSEIAKYYCSLFAGYLTAHPELCRFWKPLMEGKEQW